MILPVRPAQTELKLSEFFIMADGERSESPVEKALLTHVSSSVKARQHIKGKPELPMY